MNRPEKVSTERLDTIYYLNSVENANLVTKKAYAMALHLHIKNISQQKSKMLYGSRNRQITVNMYPTLDEELELITQMAEEEKANIKVAQAIGLLNRAPGAHVIPAYEVLLQEGIQTRLDRIKELYRSSLHDAKKEYYKSAYILLKSFQQLINRYGKQAQEDMKQAKGKEKLQLLRIVEACKHIEKKKPRTFFEAVQLVSFVHECIVDEAGSGSISFGRIDQYLYPYYKEDIENGRLQQAEAQAIVVAFFEKIAEHAGGWQNTTLGGKAKDGTDLCNELTIMCLKASAIVKKDQPQISLRVHDNMSEAVWNEALQLVKTGMGFPAFYNDDVVASAKQSVGVSEEDAWNYGIVGCVEITSGGNEYSHAEGIRINWLKLLELMLHNGKCQITGKEFALHQVYEEDALDTIESFEVFYEWYKKELVELTKKIACFIDEACIAYSSHWPVPFTSIFMNQCLEKGCDVTNNGTKYNNLTMNCVGIASTIDALQVIEELVFEQEKIKLSQLAKALKHNYEGEYENIRQACISCKKYGNNEDAVDQKATELIALFCKTLKEIQPQHVTGKYQAGFYTSHFHATMGLLTGASADGRRAAEPMSASLSPAAGKDKKGYLAVLNSANKIKMNCFANGTVLDAKFLPSFFEDARNIEGLKQSILTYFQRGGMEIQFNVVDKATLVKAQQHPEEYADLMVRVSGYSAYFVDLSRSLQDEIMMRMENSYCT